jgi:hypothetical protein
MLSLSLTLMLSLPPQSKHLPMPKLPTQLPEDGIHRHLPSPILAQSMTNGCRSPETLQRLRPG